MRRYSARGDGRGAVRSWLWPVLVVGCALGVGAWRTTQQSEHQPTRSVPQALGAAAPGAADPSGAGQGLDEALRSLGYAPSRHFAERLQERSISPAEAVGALRDGRRFYDPKNDSTIHWRNGVYVAVAPDGVLKTVIRGPVSPRWAPR